MENENSMGLDNQETQAEAIIEKPVIKKRATRKRKPVRKRKTLKKSSTMVAKKEQPVRKKRVPLGVPRARLAVNDRKGYQRRWINDRDGKILRAQEGGYNFVKSSDAEFRDSDVCNSDTNCKVVDSDGTKAYLMEITQEFYDEDQAEKQKMVNLTEEALRHGEDSHGAPGHDGRYIPKEGIKINHG